MLLQSRRASPARTRFCSDTLILYEAAVRPAALCGLAAANRGDPGRRMGMSEDKRSLWIRVFAMHQSDLAAFIRRRVRRSTDAADLAQETYLRILRANRSDLVRNPAAYLFTVATNLIREHGVLDRRRGIAVDLHEMAADSALIDFRTPEEAIDGEERLRDITAIVESLPPKLKTVLVLQHRDGMSYEQIAERLGVTTHAVKKYVVQALALCRQQVFSRKGNAR